MKNKILPILCTFILFTFVFINNNVFAYSIPTADDLYNLPDEDFLNAIYNHTHYNNGSNAVFVYNNIVFFVSGHNGFYVGDNAGVYYSIWLKNGGTIYKYTYSNGTLTSASHSYDNLTVQANGGTIYSNTDIYYENSSELFFLITPMPEIPETIPETVEIPAVETVEQIPTAMVETMKMIIPVGLVVLSVVLLIYLTRRLIYHFS